MKPGEKAWANDLRSSNHISSQWGTSRKASWEPIALIDTSPEPIPREWIAPDSCESQSQPSLSQFQTTLPTGMHELRQRAMKIAEECEVQAIKAKLASRYNSQQCVRANNMKQNIKDNISSGVQTVDKLKKENWELEERRSKLHNQLDSFEGNKTKFKSLVLAQRRAVVAVKKTEVEAKKLSAEVTEMHRANQIMDRKHRLFLKTLDSLNKTAKDMASMRSDADLEQKALVFWFNSTRGLKRAMWLLRRAVTLSKSIQSLKSRSLASEAHRILIRTFSCWMLLVKVAQFKQTVIIQRCERLVRACLIEWRDWADEAMMSRSKVEAVKTSSRKRRLLLCLGQWRQKAQESATSRQLICDRNDSLSCLKRWKRYVQQTKEERGKLVLADEHWLRRVLIKWHSYSSEHAVRVKACVVNMEVWVSLRLIRRHYDAWAELWKVNQHRRRRSMRCALGAWSKRLSYHKLLKKADVFYKTRRCDCTFNRLRLVIEDGRERQRRRQVVFAHGVSLNLKITSLLSQHQACSPSRHLIVVPKLRYLLRWREFITRASHRRKALRQVNKSGERACQKHYFGCWKKVVSAVSELNWFATQNSLRRAIRSLASNACVRRGDFIQSRFGKRKLSPITTQSAFQQFPSFGSESDTTTYSSNQTMRRKRHNDVMRALKLRQTLRYWVNSQRKKKCVREMAQIVSRRKRLCVKQRCLNTWTMVMLREVIRTREEQHLRISSELDRITSLESKLAELAMGEKELEDRKALLLAEHHALKKMVESQERDDAACCTMKMSSEAAQISLAKELIQVVQEAEEAEAERRALLALITETKDQEAVLRARAREANQRLAEEKLFQHTQETRCCNDDGDSQEHDDDDGDDDFSVDIEKEVASARNKAMTAERLVLKARERDVVTLSEAQNNLAKLEILISERVTTLSNLKVTRNQLQSNLELAQKRMLELEVEGLAGVEDGSPLLVPHSVRLDEESKTQLRRALAEQEVLRRAAAEQDSLSAKLKQLVATQEREVNELLSAIGTDPPVKKQLSGQSSQEVAQLLAGVLSQQSSYNSNTQVCSSISSASSCEGISEEALEELTQRASLKAAHAARTAAVMAKNALNGSLGGASESESSASSSSPIDRDIAAVQTRLLRRMGKPLPREWM